MRISRLGVGAAGGLLCAALILPQALQSLDRLSDARTDHARLVSQAARPERAAQPLVQATWRATQGDATAASRALSNRIRSVATSGGLLVEMLELRRAPQGLAAVAFRISGPEKSVIAFADTIGRDPPLVRLRQWQFAQGEGGGVRMSGIAVTPWQ